MAGEIVKDANGKTLLVGEDYSSIGGGFNLVVDGDSQTGGEAGNWFDLLSAMSPYTGARAYNYGVSAKRAAQAAGAWNSTGPKGFTVNGGRQYSPVVTGRRGIYFCYLGINDLGGDNATGATVFGYVSSLWAAAKADGYGKVVAFTLPPVSWFSGAQETQRLAFNTAVRAATGYDLLVDLARLFPVATGNLFDDGLHISPLGQRILANHIAALLTGGARPLRHLMTAKINTDNSIPAGTMTQLVNWVVVDDIFGLLQANGKCLCPEDGAVRVNVHYLNSGVSAGDTIETHLYINGDDATRRLIGYENAGQATTQKPGQVALPVAAGDLLDIRTYRPAGPVHTGGNSTWTVEYVRYAN